MHLLIGNVALRIAQMGSDFLLVDSDAAYGPCRATVRLRVDADERQWEVYLPEGVAAGAMQPVATSLPAGQTARREAGLAEVMENRA